MVALASMTVGRLAASAAIGMFLSVLAVLFLAPAAPEPSPVVSPADASDETAGQLAEMERELARLRALLDATTHSEADAEPEGPASSLRDDDGTDAGERARVPKPSPARPPPMAGSPDALPCLNDSACGFHRCNLALARCAFPCSVEAHCKAGFYCASTRLCAPYPRR
jgi:hypothetical protein